MENFAKQCFWKNLRKFCILYKFHHEDCINNKLIFEISNLRPTTKSMKMRLNTWYYYYALLTNLKVVCDYCFNLPTFIYTGNLLLHSRFVGRYNKKYILTFIKRTTVLIFIIVFTYFGRALTFIRITINYNTKM